MKRIIAFLLIGVGSQSPMALAQGQGTFTRISNLSIPRQFHTANLLPNGRVLIAGGFSDADGSFTTWASAELYDPSNGKFTPTGDMNNARYSHTATLLPNGKVLITGGSFRNGGPALDSAELYDPETGTFSATGSMTAPRSFHTATLLKSGRVLIAGGGDYTPGALQIAELYDPSTGTFSATGAMTEGGAETATLLPNGTVLITRWIDYDIPSHAETYDPAAGAFTRTSDLIDPNQGSRPKATLLPSGKVLISGGDLDDFGGSASAEIYDPATGTFSSAAKMTAGLDAWASATLLPEGRVLLAGRYDGVACSPVIGQPSQGTCPGTAEVYDSASGTFGPSSPFQSMEGHAATLLPDGTVLLSGGWICCGTTISTVEIYHPLLPTASPILYSLDGGGKGQGAIQHAGTVRIASAADPAVAGEYLSIYLTGLVDGNAIPPQVAIGGQPAEVTFFGDVPGYPGLNVVNLRMPSGVMPGDATPVRLDYLSRPSNQVTIGTR